MQNKIILEKLIEVFQLFQEFEKSNFENIYENLNMNEVHSIDYIGKNKNPNVTSISLQLNITRGAATKITQRLIAKGYISEYKLESNKKEKFFSLTQNGEKIFEKHKTLHKQSIERDIELFENFNKNEKDTILRFLNVLKEDFTDKLNLKDKS